MTSRTGLAALLLALAGPAATQPADCRLEERFRTEVGGRAYAIPCRYSIWRTNPATPGVLPLDGLGISFWMSDFQPPRHFIPRPISLRPPEEGRDLQRDSLVLMWRFDAAGPQPSRATPLQMFRNGVWVTANWEFDRVGDLLRARREFAAAGVELNYLLLRFYPEFRTGAVAYIWCVPDRMDPPLVRTCTAEAEVSEWNLRFRAQLAPDQAERFGDIMGHVMTLLDSWRATPP